MATNLWAKFRRLLPGDPKLIVTVNSVNADGTSTVTTPAGGAMIVIGTSVPAGQKAYVRGGAIVDKAPTLTHYEIEV